MLIKFNPSIAGYAANNIGTNKNISFKKNPATTGVELFKILKGVNPDDEARFVARELNPAIGAAKNPKALMQELVRLATQAKHWSAAGLKNLLEQF